MVHIFISPTEFTQDTTFPSFLGQVNLSQDSISKSEESVVGMPKTQATQALCVLNSHSSLAPSETYLKSLVPKPAAKQ
jgi:hypothetical protein